MRALPPAALAAALLLAVPASTGHDADALYAPALVVLHGDGSGAVDLLLSPPGWTCSGVTTTPHTVGTGNTHRVACTPPTAPPGLVPGCTDVYAGALAWVDVPGPPTTHFPTPSLVPVGTIAATASCAFGGLVQADASVLVPAPGVGYRGEDAQVHLDALRCEAVETWLPTGPTEWVAQCGANVGFVGSYP